MKIVVLSDLHIGVKGQADNNFIMDDAAFAAHLDRLSKANDVIVLNGDVFELWEGVAVAAAHAEHWNDLTKERLKLVIKSWPLTYKMIIDLIQSKKIILVNGNHDAQIRSRNLLGDDIPVYENYTIEMGPYRIRIEHGHQGDIWCDEKSVLGCFSWMATQSKSALEDLINKKLDSTFELLEKTIDTSDDKIAKYAGKLGRAIKADVIVFGHTHGARLEKVANFAKSDVIYANSGKASDSEDVIDEVAVEIFEKGDTIISLNKVSVLTGRIEIVNTMSVSKKWSKVFTEEKEDEISDGGGTAPAASTTTTT